jgi:hypothetical protein
MIKLIIFTFLKILLTWLNEGGWRMTFIEGRGTFRGVISLKMKAWVGEWCAGGFWRTGIWSVSQWPRGLRHEPSSLGRTLGSWVRISLKARMSVSFILCAGSGLVMGWSPAQGILPDCEKAAKVHKGCRAVDREIGYEEVDWIHLLQYNLNMATDLEVS